MTSSTARTRGVAALATVAVAGAGLLAVAGSANADGGNGESSIEQHHGAHDAPRVGRKPHLHADDRPAGGDLPAGEGAIGVMLLEQQRKAGIRATSAADPSTSCDGKLYDTIAGKKRVVADLGGGKQLSNVETVRALRRGGFTWAEMKTALAVVAAESNRCPNAKHYNLSRRTGAFRSVDIGLWQVNTKYHPQFRSWKLSHPVVASKAARRIKNRAGSWKPWYGYAHRDLYAQWASKAYAEARAAGVQ